MTKTVTFEKIVGGGKALGYLDGKPCFAAGPLPGEVAEIEIIKEKTGYLEAAVVRFVEPSPRRSGTAEDHYLSCSPWQNVDYEYQLELKRGVLAEAFSRSEPALEVPPVVGAHKQLGYRNKLEFSLMQGSERLDLAFHNRGSYEDLVALPQGCLLGTTDMNEAALELAAKAQALKLGGYIETLTVRRSESNGRLLGHIALHQVPKRDWSSLATPLLASIVVSRLRGRSAHELIWNSGTDEVVDVLGGNELAYPYDGFFQTNVPLFETILEAILKAIPKDGRVVDLYGGVGTIGIAAAKFSREVVGIEINQASTQMAEANALRAELSNYRALAVPAQSLDAKVFAATDCVVLDPPRAGLEGAVIDALLEAKPARIVYLSCNPATQARDVKLLNEGYVAKTVTGYDLYPGTLHLESLIILDRV